MPSHNLVNELSDEFDFDVLHGAEQPQSARKLRRAPRSKRAVLEEMLRYGEIAGDAATAVFSPTLQASRHERDWIVNYLGPYYDKKLIVDVLRRVKGGKEANVYCCRAHPALHPELGIELLAAKLYRPRMFRNLRNDALYRQGRRILDDNGKAVRDDRLLRAVRKGTRVGKEVQHTSWLEHEYLALVELHAAGADVPRPVASGDNTVLMEYVGDLQTPAPALTEVRLTRAEARATYERLLWNVGLMLQHGRVHGDLSAYNVLYWQGRACIIDWPQVIDPAANRTARAILARDVTRLCDHFTRYGIRSNPSVIAADLWEQYGPGDEIDPLLLEMEPEPAAEEIEGQPSLPQAYQASDF